jgi:hypothetical protein
LKVAHIISGRLDGGAALGLYYLHEELLKNGVESTIIVPFIENLGGYNKKHIKEYYSSIAGKLFFKVLRKVELALTKLIGHNVINTGLVGININRIKQYDIVHIHQFEKGFISLVFKPLINIRLTSRDHWIFTNGCSYKSMCTKNCTLCGQQKGLLIGLKKRFLKNLPIGFLSEVDLRLSKNYGYNGYYVSNTTHSLYFDLNNTSNEHRKYNVLIITYDFNAEYKGYRKLKKLGMFDSQFLCIGKNASYYSLNPDSIDGLLDPTGLIKYYLESSIYVHLSTDESFGKTALEAALAGCFIIAIRNSGPAAFVTEGVNGVLIDSILEFEQALVKANLLRRNHEFNRVIVQLRQEYKASNLMKLNLALYANN